MFEFEKKKMTLRILTGAKLYNINNIHGFHIFLFVIDFDVYSKQRSQSHLTLHLSIWILFYYTLNSCSLSCKWKDWYCI